MNDDSAAPAAVRGAGRPADGVSGAFRFAAEPVAWIAAPWCPADRSRTLAVLSPVVPVGLPAVFATPGDRAQVLVAVPGPATVALVLLEIAAAVGSAWALWPGWAAVCVSVLGAVAVVTERHRRRWLLRGAGAAPAAGSGGRRANDLA